MEGILQSIGNSFVNFFSSIGTFFSGISEIVSNIASFVISIFGFLWYAGKTLIGGISKLIYYISGGAVFTDVSNTFIQLSQYIGPRGVLFMASMMSIIIVRILFTFVMKILKGHVGYTALKDKEKYYDIRDNMKKYK